LSPEGRSPGSGPPPSICGGQTPLIFEYRGMAVGYFTETAGYPSAVGPCKYVPYRGPGHYEMQMECRRSGSALCTYRGPEGQVSFTVRGSPEYGVLELDGFTTVT
jgi:hypothetical protein